jgi:hypothetical protein
MRFDDMIGGLKCWRATALREIGLEGVFSNGYLFHIEMTNVPTAACSARCKPRRVPGPLLGAAVICFTSLSYAPVASSLILGCFEPGPGVGWEETAGDGANRALSPFVAAA